MILFCNYSIAQKNNSDTSQIAKKPINIALDSLKSDKDLRNSSIGFCALDTKTGTIIAELNSQQTLVPASNMKIVTTAAVLEIFGKNYQFKTFLQYDGYIDSACVLQGNIYIKGGGDPTLGSNLFQKNNTNLFFLTHWTNAISQLGIHKIKGAIIADDELFSGEAIPSTWIWGDIGNYYGAGASALSIFDNNYEIEFETGDKSGEKTVVKTITPCIPYLDLKNEVLSSEIADDNSCIFGAPLSEERIIKGSIPINTKSFKVRGAIPTPPLLAAMVLDEHLKSYGISVSKNPKTIQHSTFNIQHSKLKITFDTLYSPTLDTIIYWTNMKSINSYCENILNHIGLEKNKIGSTASGTFALKEFWKSKGIDTQGMFLSDGSGLSRNNGITAFQLSQIMKYMTTSKEYFSFYKSLPVAGRSGTLASLCIGTAAEGNLRAKSGSMSRVRAYTGFVTTKKGNQLAFAMIVNNYNCSAEEMKKKFEKLMIVMAEME